LSLCFKKLCKYHQIYVLKNYINRMKYHLVYILKYKSDHTPFKYIQFTFYHLIYIFIRFIYIFFKILILVISIKSILDFKILCKCIRRYGAQCESNPTGLSPKEVRHHSSLNLFVHLTLNGIRVENESVREQ